MAWGIYFCIGALVGWTGSKFLDQCVQEVTEEIPLSTITVQGMLYLLFVIGWFPFFSFVLYRYLRDRVTNS